MSNESMWQTYKLRAETAEVRADAAHQSYVAIQEENVQITQRANALAKALTLLLAEVVKSGNAYAKDYGWPTAIKASCDALGVTLQPKGLQVILIDKDAALAARGDAR